MTKADFSFFCVVCVSFDFDVLDLVYPYQVENVSKVTYIVSSGT